MTLRSCSLAARALPYFHLRCTIFHMKTTLIIPDHLMREIRRRAAERGETLSEVVAEALRRGLDEPRAPASLPPLPSHRMGRPRVDLHDRNALYRLMEEG
jgi:hypothetical protein